MNGTRTRGTQAFRNLPAMPPCILLVEDEPMVREVTRNVLEMGGYYVLAADGPASAVLIAGDESTTIDLLLTDVIMPGMNGPELARQLKDLRPELVTLFMTGYAESEALRLATYGSAQKHIQKPFTVNGLLARVAEALAKQRNYSADDSNRRFTTS